MNCKDLTAESTLTDSWGEKAQMELVSTEVPIHTGQKNASSYANVQGRTICKCSRTTLGKRHSWKALKKNTGYIQKDTITERRTFQSEGKNESTEEDRRHGHRPGTQDKHQAKLKR